MTITRFPGGLTDGSVLHKELGLALLGLGFVNLSPSHNSG